MSSSQIPSKVQFPHFGKTAEGRVLDEQTDGGWKGSYYRVQRGPSIVRVPVEDAEAIDDD